VIFLYPKGLDLDGLEGFGLAEAGLAGDGLEGAGLVGVGRDIWWWCLVQCMGRS